ncbi:holo-ACP synthase [Streptomyces albireticuli]|uniref:holo-ACP synthase n=1 Tax=Streptomyces albireticuli TaxID=1940 RepID=UPI0036B7061E
MNRGRVGIDLVPYGRVRSLLTAEGRPVLSRMLSGAELALSRTDTGPDVPGIAGRLAAKEAVFKLFRAAGQTLPWQDIEILKEDGGWPVVRLGGRAARLARAALVEYVDVSISHDDPCAIAIAYSGPAPESPLRWPATPDDAPETVRTPVDPAADRTTEEWKWLRQESKTSVPGS